MDTELTLEYGKRFKNTRTVHEELLCCYSSTAAQMFKDAQPFRKSYAASDDLRKELKEFVSPRVTKEQFDADHLENKARYLPQMIMETFSKAFVTDDSQTVPLIVIVYEGHPLRSYRPKIQTAIDAVIVEEVSTRHVVGTGSKVLFAKKDLKDMGIKLRLQALQSKGVMEVAQRLSSVLRQIKHEEREAAKISTKKAVAQRRWMLPDAEDRDVRSLVTWMYCNGALHWDDAE